MAKVNFNTINIQASEKTEKDYKKLPEHIQERIAKDLNGYIKMHSLSNNSVNLLFAEMVDQAIKTHRLVARELKHIEYDKRLRGA